MLVIQGEPSRAVVGPGFFFGRKHGCDAACFELVILWRLCFRCDRTESARN